MPENPEAIKFSDIGSGVFFKMEIPTPEYPDFMVLILEEDLPE